MFHKGVTLICPTCIKPFHVMEDEAIKGTECILCGYFSEGVKKTVEEPEQLKSNWMADPCWDLYDTEGFEEHKEELKVFQKQCELYWLQQLRSKELQLKLHAENLGLVGLYKLIVKQQEEIEKLKEDRWSR